eukprot:5758029-Pyramimonas_sp.AAC.1
MSAADYQFWRRSATADEKAQCDATVGNIAKTGFRRQWRERFNLKNLKATRANSQEERRGEGLRGEPLPRSVLIREQGGHEGPEAVEAADRIICKALQRGYPCAAYNTDSERV